jgi:hypothetical protein
MRATFVSSNVLDIGHDTLADSLVASRCAAQWCV